MILLVENVTLIYIRRLSVKSGESGRREQNEAPLFFFRCCDSTSQLQTWIGIPPNVDGDSWKTNVDVDAVCSAAAHRAPRSELCGLGCIMSQILCHYQLLL